MKITLKYKFANLTQGGYRHYPILYLAHGSDGFVLCIVGVEIIVTFKTNQDNDNT